LLEEKGDVDGAISEFMTALGLDHNCSSCQLHLSDALDKKNSTSSDQILSGNSFYSSGQLPRAAAAYRIAIHISPDDAVAHNSLAWTLYRLGDVEEGMDEINIALKLRPDDPEFVNTLACLYYEKGDLNGAIATWKKAIEKSKKPGAADLYGLAVGMLDKGDEKKASIYFNQAIEADPKYKDLFYVTNRVGMSVKAVSYHDRLLKLTGMESEK
jgi:tetratricopeptide (TPR) repeat protein